MEDAETAKDIDKNISSVKVIIAQAEAYYHMGQFERALGESQALNRQLFHLTLDLSLLLQSREN